MDRWKSGLEEKLEGRIERRAKWMMRNRDNVGAEEPGGRQVMFQDQQKAKRMQKRSWAHVNKTDAVQNEMKAEYL